VLEPSASVTALQTKGYAKGMPRMLSGEKGSAEARQDSYWGAVLGLTVVRLDTLICSLKRRCDLLRLCGIVRADNVSSRMIRLAAYVTRLERVRGSRPSWVQIPHPPPVKISDFCTRGRGRDFSFCHLPANAGM